MQSRARATLLLTLECNNQCAFCALEGAPGAPPPVDEKLSLLRQEHDELTLVGGEPLLLPDLAGVVETARRAGFSRIGLQSNGRGLADAKKLTTLAAAGLTDLHLSLHGASAASHDYHTNVSGSHAAIFDTLRAARPAGLTLVVATVVTRSNFRELSELPDQLRAFGVAAWLLMLPHAAGRALDAFDRLVPRLALAVPFVLHAISRARDRGLAAWVRGAPHCLLGPLVDFALPGEERQFGGVCAGCLARPDCCGVDGAYLERFGENELAAVSSAQASSMADATLARVFVGTGPRRSARREPTERPHRPVRSLPVLGKARPALAEAERGAEKRSGTELRQILPELFPDRDD